MSNENMTNPNKYVGVDKDFNGGMTAIGKIIRDAWVFGLIPETETCENWDLGRINALLQQVDVEWDKYGCLVSQLPKVLFERHQAIHGAALEKARDSGWTGEKETDGEK